MILPLHCYKWITSHAANFPQNTDKGTIFNASGEASFPVLHVSRRTGESEGLTAVHFIANRNEQEC